VNNALALGAAAVLIAGCGSTVQVRGTAGLPADAGLGVGDGTPVAPGTAPAGTATRTPSSLAPGTVATSSPQDGPTSVTEPLGPAKALATRKGSLVIGYITTKDIESAGSALGLAGIATGDPDNQMRTLAADINGRGGILGHKVVLVSHDVSTAQATSNPEGAIAEACAAFKEKKAAIVVNMPMSKSALDCLRSAGIVSVTSTSIAQDATYFRDGLPGVYSPSAMSIDRYLPAVVDRLQAQGYFRGWNTQAGDPGPAPVKIGVQAFDNAQGRHYVAVLGRALAKHGFKIDQQDLHSTDVSQNAAATSAAVLRFASNGVTHVFNANVLFYKDAESQRYYPRFAVDDTTPTPALMAQNVAQPGRKGILHGAMGAGYLPAYEVPSPKDVSPAATRCKDMMRRAGENTGESLTLAYVLHACDAMWFLEKAFAAGGELTTHGLRRGLAVMSPHVSTITYGSKITVGHRDGANRVRDFAFDDACGCFEHPSTRTYAVPD